MNAMLLEKAAPVENGPLVQADLPVPEPGPGELLVKVTACGVCHTDLHTVEGEIPAHLPIVPGHQAVGRVAKLGPAVAGWQTDDRAGIPWLHRTCGRCDCCRRGQENLCDVARFTGQHVHGGYAEYALAVADYAVKIPERYEDTAAAPLLCAGIVGFRAWRMSGGKEPRRLGLCGFGASAHLVIQVARQYEQEVFVATRSAEHRALARELGAAWVGDAAAVPDAALDAVILFAPAGGLVPESLRALRKGGCLVLAGIYMTPIPKLAYNRLYHERVVRSVANATREDARSFLELAREIRLQTTVTEFPLEEANQALLALKRSELKGAGVLVVNG